MRGDETPAEVIVFAYGMEKGLQAFYQETHDRTEDQALKDLSAMLVTIEENHKRMLQGLYAGISPEKGSDALEAEADPKTMEGGFDVKEFMRQNEPHLQGVAGVVDLAMMLETQALDLYLRYAARSAHPESKEVLFKIADEEKAHLAALGRLLEERT